MEKFTGENLTNSVEIYSTIYNDIPYAVLNPEVKNMAFLSKEIDEIKGYYKVYSKGAAFNVEGTAGTYVASQLKFKKTAQLINKEARFLFGESPTITIKPKGDVGKVSKEMEDAITNLQDLVDTILEKNQFSKYIVKAARDCFIGKRVACLVNFNEEYGVTISFIDSLHFVYDFDSISGELKKFVCFDVDDEEDALNKRRVYKKKYEKVEGVVYLEENVYDGTGALLYTMTEYQATKLENIPAVVILNDGLLSDKNGESEVGLLSEYESVYSKLSNADIDAERKGMNQIKVAIDMDSNTTKNLPIGPGAFWDLQSNQQLEHASPSVTTIPVDMNYSPALVTTLGRINSEMYGQIEMPNISLETMVGTITSGKALKAIYWPLIVRCKEKMKTWGPMLSALIDIIIEGSFAYPNTIERYVSEPLKPVNYVVDIEQNFPLPEDIEEEKNMALLEVSSQVMSKKTYIKKYGDKTDDEAMQEIEQIALERQMLEEGYTDVPNPFASESEKEKSIEEEEIDVQVEEEIL